MFSINASLNVNSLFLFKYNGKVTQRINLYQIFSLQIQDSDINEIN